MKANDLIAILERRIKTVDHNYSDGESAGLTAIAAAVIALKAAKEMVLLGWDDEEPVKGKVEERCTCANDHPYSCVVHRPIKDDKFYHMETGQVFDNEKDYNTYVDSLNETIQTYKIFSEGYCATGTEGRTTDPVYHGIGEGISFKDACVWLFKHDKYFDHKNMTYWGCKLYDHVVEGES